MESDGVTSRSGMYILVDCLKFELLIRREDGRKEPGASLDARDIDDGVLVPAPGRCEVAYGPRLAAGFRGDGE